METVVADEKRILVVEDNEGLRYAHRVALERAGMVVDCAENGREAVQMINSSGAIYSCVLLDMILPQIHGSSVLTHIARVAPDLPVVAVTGFPDRVLFSDPADRRVVKAIFVKPVDPRGVAAYLQVLAAGD
jgi:DNA-binding NtrC family response regulator